MEVKSKNNVVIKLDTAEYQSLIQKLMSFLILKHRTQKLRSHNQWMQVKTSHRNHQSFQKSKYAEEIKMFIYNKLLSDNM